MNEAAPIGIEERNRALARSEGIIANLLRFGVWGSIAMVLLGMAITFIHHPEFLTSREALAVLINPQAAQARSGGEVLHGVEAAQGRMFVMLGLLLLIATPVLRVLVSIVLFLMQGDKIFAAITTLVLAILLLSFWMGSVS